MSNMKRFILLVAALFIMGGVMAQNNGQNKPKEYVSVLLTFSSRQFPMDSLNAYGVKIQTQAGSTATALIPAGNYEAFLRSGIAERVQPSTHVFLTDGQVDGSASDNTYRPVRPQQNQNDMRADNRPERCNDGTRAPRGDCHHHHGAKPGHHPHAYRPERGADDVALDNEDARGFYLGILLGDSRNVLRIEKIDGLRGTWYPAHGIDAQLLIGYQFNRWFGLRTAAQFVNKSYATDLIFNNKNYETTYNNLYIQAPLLADFSVGGRNARLHFMLGGYCGYWMTQYRNGYIHSPNGTSGIGYKSGFEEGYNEHLDAGAAAGLGLTFRLSPACLLHLEGTYFYGLTTTTAAPNSTFNRTCTLDMGISYHF